MHLHITYWLTYILTGLCVLSDENEKEIPLMAAYCKDVNETLFFCLKVSKILRIERWQIVYMSSKETGHLMFYHNFGKCHHNIYEVVLCVQ